MIIEKEFRPTADQVKTYREKHELGITEAADKLTKLNMIKHLEEGGTAEVVLLYLLKDWAKDETRTG